MKDGKNTAGAQPSPGAAPSSIPNRILGSLRDALNAAGREPTADSAAGEHTELLPRTAPGAARQAPPPVAAAVPRPPEIPTVAPAPPVSAAAALREAKAPGSVPVAERQLRHFEASEPTTRAIRANTKAPAASSATAPARTQALRGRPKVERAAFHQDPVVGWLVIVGGPGLGAFRPIHEGNNAVGRGKGQRIPIDFGDDAISSEEQAYIRYDSTDRSFLFVPNLAKTNIVAVNDKKPTGAVKLEAMDVITMGRTQLAFVPFCGHEFDWSELSELKE
jgi:hypothetical protein